MIAPPLNADYISSLPTLNDVIRRAIDGTQTITYSSILLSGNIKFSTIGDGVIMKAASGNSYLLNIVEVTNADGSIRPVIQLTKQ